jgi:hypothetical protein
MTYTWTDNATTVGDTTLTIHTSPQGLYYFEAQVITTSGGKWYHPGREMCKTAAQAQSHAETWFDSLKAATK